MKKIEDYLHLYFKCWGTVSESNCRYENGNWALSAMLLHEVMMGNCKFIPHLRPLSSMTENEFIEAGKIHISEGGSIHISIGELKRGGIHAMRPETFRHLLSLGFDLFGLIESGLAIDKTFQPS